MFKSSIRENGEAAPHDGDFDVKKDMNVPRQFSNKMKQRSKKPISQRNDLSVKEGLSIIG